MQLTCCALVFQSLFYEHFCQFLTFFWNLILMIFQLHIIMQIYIWMEGVKHYLLQTLNKRCVNGFWFFCSNKWKMAWVECCFKNWSWDYSRWLLFEFLLRCTYMTKSHLAQQIFYLIMPMLYICKVWRPNRIFCMYDLYLPVERKCSSAGQSLGHIPKFTQMCWFRFVSYTKESKFWSIH